LFGYIFLPNENFPHPAFFLAVWGLVFLCFARKDRTPFFDYDLAHRQRQGSGSIF